jgi:tripartite-type tricarboxylate transporter receptor subunit TctC
MRHVERYRRRMAAVAFALFAALVAPFAIAQGYPEKPIRLLVPMPPGGGTDFWARLTTAKMSESLGQPIIVENRPGAGTIIAAESVAKAAADGYTLLIGDIGTFAVNPSLYRQLPYHPANDFAPITLTSRHALVLVAHPSFPADSVAAFIALARARPGGIDYGSAGPGSPHHLAMALFEQRTGTRLHHIPYKGGAPLAQDLVAGQLAVAFLDLPSALGHIRAGRLKALATASARRLASLPAVPTVAESGLAGYEADAWQGLVAPAGTPIEIVAKLNAAYARAVADPEVKRRLLEVGIDPTPSSPEAFRDYQQREAARWGEQVRRLNISAE